MSWLFLKKSEKEANQNISSFQDKIIVRPACIDDYEEWVRVRSENRDFLTPYEPSWPKNALTKEFFYRRIEILETHARADKSYSYLIFDTNPALVGGININHVCRGAAQYASLGYWLDRKSQGQGYMTMAGLSVLHHAFTELGLERMNAATLPDNQKSQMLLERLGFSQEGFARSYIQIDGQRRDHILYGLNKGDFMGSRIPRDV